MDDMAKLGDLAVKLEKYRYYIVSALSWVVFGMIFGSMIILGNSLILFGFGYEVLWFLLAFAGVSAGYTYGKFLKYMPMKENSKKWIVGVLLMFVPFVASYSIIPIVFKIHSAFYFNTVWYPSLGLGLLLFGLCVEDKLKMMVYSGISIVLSSSILIPISKIAVNFKTVMASGLLCLSMMLFIYFIASIYTFFKAQKIVYA